MELASTWTRDELENLVLNRVQEGHQLDYKDCRALCNTDKCRDDLSRNVSAFANSSGGILIYGIRENNHFPVELDEGCDPTEISREWLEQTIDGNIRPRIQGLRIHQIDNGHGRCFYVVEIPQAVVQGPHQARDYRYYRRGTFKSEPMYDYEVKDVQRRSTAPALHLLINFAPVEQLIAGIRFQMTLAIGNRAIEPALYSRVALMIDQRVTVEKPHEFDQIENFAAAGPDKIPINNFTRNLTVPHHLPIFREVVWSLGRFTLILPDRGPFSFGYQLVCPGFSAGFWGDIRYDASTEAKVALTLAETQPPVPQLD